jgi:curli biogenesis system outer membrane secretion channel CsgG
MLATGKNCQLKFPLAADLEGGRHSALLVLSSAIALCNNAARRLLEAWLSISIPSLSFVAATCSNQACSCRDKQFLHKEYAVRMISRMVLSGAAIAIAATLGGCATESSRALPVAKVESATQAWSGARVPMAVGKFDNRSSYMRGIFSDGVDRLGGQAKTILITHLQQTNRFSVLDRDNMGEIQQEAAIKGQAQRLKGADFVVTGDVTEFGRKETGDRQLFGILGRGKTQVAYAKVNLNIVNISTSEVVYSTQGAGEYALSNREVIGFGGTASYDSTLNGKVLDLAMREAINRLVDGMNAGAWKPGN